MRGDREEQRAKAADGGVPIDDTLLRQAFKANNEAAARQSLGTERWAEFKEKCEDAGIVGHLSEEEQELLQIKESLALMAKMSGDDEKKKREAERKKRKP